MTKYLLDTNIVSYLEDETSPFHQSVRKRLSQLSNVSKVYVSLLTLFEIHYGIAYLGKDKANNLLSMKNSIKDNFVILYLTDKNAEIFGTLKSLYRKKTGIGKKEIEQHNIDFMIASTAISENAVLVSNDSIFTHIKNLQNDLQLENWAG